MENRKWVFFALAIFFSATPLLAEEYPFAGTVVGEDVNVRAGANLNYEIVCKLDNNDAVIVLAKAYDWYKVRLKENAVVFINKPFLRKINDSEAEVVGSDVNVRARPNTNSTILGKLAKGDRVGIVREVPEWYQVVPPASLSGYVFASYVQYKSSYAEYLKEKTRRETFEKRLTDIRAMVEGEFKKERRERSFLVSIKSLETLRREYPEHASSRGILQELDRLRIKQLELENERVKLELAETKAKLGSQ